MTEKQFTILQRMVLTALEKNQHHYQFRLKTELTKEDVDFFNKKGFKSKYLGEKKYQISWKQN